MVGILCPHCNKEHEDDELIYVDQIPDYIADHMEMLNDHDQKEINILQS